MMFAKLHYISFLILLLAQNPASAWAQNSNSLYERTLDALNPRDRNEGEISIPFQQRLLELGDANDVGPVLVRIVQQYRTAQPGEPYALARQLGAIAGLRILGWKSAFDLLQEIASDSSAHAMVRSAALRALGEFDLARAKNTLLAALEAKGHWSDLIRGAATETLARADDPEVADQLDGAARREGLPTLRRQMEDAATKVRARVVQSTP